MEKYILSTLLIVSLSFGAYCAVNKPSSGSISIQKIAKINDDPNYVTGAMNYYTADRDPLSLEPTINPGYYDPNQILWFRNRVTGDLFYLKTAVNNGDGTYSLTWVLTSVMGSF